MSRTLTTDNRPAEHAEVLQAETDALRRELRRLRQELAAKDRKIATLEAELEARPIGWAS